MKKATPLLDKIGSPQDLKALSRESLPQLAAELRRDVVRVVSQTGGHLGAGLGVIELTIALHYVFSAPKDKLVWDVGHQTYPHKILTGRREAMEHLRQDGGISGFPRRAESEYDAFGTAHSSTSISAAFGMAVARDLKGEAYNCVAIIGDGAMTAGMAFEALNCAGAQKTRLIVILNDNQMSISHPAGALSDHLAHIPDAVNGKQGKPRAPVIFEQLGFKYVGPIDGHNLKTLVDVLEQARDGAAEPVLIHVRTQKGKGYPPAETAEDKYHGVNRFDMVTGTQAKASSNAPSYTSVFAKSLIVEAHHDSRIVAVTAAMPTGTGLDRFGEIFPSRVFDTGIAEQHAVTFAAGLAADGIKPFVAIYSTFLQRAYDQVVHDVVLQGLPVRFPIDRAGYVGADGPTHCGAFDVGFLSSLPGMVVMAASDEAELFHMVATAAAYDEGPIAFRYPRGEGLGVELPTRGEVLPIGKGRVLREGSDVALLSFGTRAADCLLAAEDLAARDMSVTVADARFAKPLDEALIATLARNHKVLVTIEEGAVGGFGEHVLHLLANRGFLDRGLVVRSLVLPDEFTPHASPAKMYARAGLDRAGIVAAVLQATGKA